MCELHCHWHTYTLRTQKISKSLKAYLLGGRSHLAVAFDLNIFELSLSLFTFTSPDFRECYPQHSDFRHFRLPEKKMLAGFTAR